MSPSEIEALSVRVGNGLSWLAEHDPHGSFYAWWQAGLTPQSRLPAHEATPEVVEQWREWYNAKLVWDKLDRALAAEEDRGHAPLPWALPWVPPEGDVRI
jgi:hypothetical protein